MAIERALRYAGRGGDLGDRDAIDALGGEEVERGAIDLGFYPESADRKSPCE
jgi:hypothetical protein